MSQLPASRIDNPESVSHSAGPYPVGSEARFALHERVRAAIADVRAGKMVILVDDEDRENEGDLTIAADQITPEAINFMAKYGRGLICLTLVPDQVDRLELPMMTVPGRTGPKLGTAFTHSIEARHGVSTGISAADRAHTIRVAISSESGPDDVVMPGHVFPLRSRTGGVLVRAGQTEGSVDLARLAGLTPAGVICEIMNEDGTMARMEDLEKFAQIHQLRVLSIADLIAYRLQTERLVRRIESTEIVLERTRSTWHAMVYESTTDRQQLLALVKGDPTKADRVLCRMHAGSALVDTFGTVAGNTHALSRAIDAIEKEGVGALVYLPPATDLRTELAALKHGGEKSAPRTETLTAEDTGDALRDYGLGAQVLRELGIRCIRLLTNTPRRIAALQGHGLEVVERVSLD